MFEPKDKSFDKDSLRTPQFIYDWLDEKYKFNVDLAASDEHHLHIRYFTKELSALNKRWAGFMDAGFCNPPYSDIDPWVEKAIKEANEGFTTVFIIPDFNGEGRFNQISEHATTIIHLIGRVNFIRPDNGKEYKGNNRGSAIFEFSKKYWDTPPQHLYIKTKDIKEQYE
jgi:phage N-6-adenine-methyltransferase